MRLLLVFFTLSLALPTAGLAAYVDIEEVRFMAFDKGIVNIDKVELDDGVWEVEGEDANGNEIEMKVDARSGHIIKLERD